MPLQKKALGYPITKIANKPDCDIAKYKSPGDLYFAFVHDIHLGNNNTPTEHILSNLYRDFGLCEENIKLDGIFIIGDLFDKQLDLGNNKTNPILVWLSSLLYLCAKYNIKLRVIKGTPSHDWDQLTLFNTLIDCFSTGIGSKYKIDFKYYDTCDIEVFDDWDLSFLYIPDEFRDNCLDTQQYVKELLAANNLTSVNYVCMHGQFKYQIPMAKDEHCHDELFYLGICKKYILIGHVHIKNPFYTILPGGSYDRIAQGEEAAKGHYRILNKSVEHNQDDTVQFVENKGAKLYITIDARGKLVTDLPDLLLPYLNSPIDSSFRLLVDNNDIKDVLGEIKKQYPLFNWSIKKDKASVKRSDENGIKLSFTPTTLTKQNAYDVLRSKIEAALPTSEIKTKCLMMLQSKTI